MTSDRGRLIPSVLMVLALLLPDAVGAQDNGCSSDSYEGNDCSAGCYVDQTPSCTFNHAGSLFYGSCTCQPGSGGGGAAGSCGGMALSSRTLVIGSDRGAGLADHQLRFDLQHPGDRREGAFLFEEWALVSSAGDKATVLGASTAELANRVQNVAEHFRPHGRDTSTVLVIEQAERSHNSREIPVPEVAPIDFDAGLPVGEAGQEAWFRAEVGADGVVDQVILLNRPEAFASFSINEQLRENLRLRYADGGRHRVVVFGAVRADAQGHLAMTKSLVVLPTRCCGGSRCA